MDLQRKKVNVSDMLKGMPERIKTPFGTATLHRIIQTLLSATIEEIKELTGIRLLRAYAGALLDGGDLQPIVEVA